MTPLICKIIQLPLVIFGIIVWVGRSKEVERAAIAVDFGATSREESDVADLRFSLLTTGGGVDRFRALGFSKLAANALKAGDLPRTRTRSGLKEVLLER